MLPSAIARPLLERELPDYVSALDWYAFDVAGADTYHRLAANTQADTPTTAQGIDAARQQLQGIAASAPSDIMRLPNGDEIGGGWGKLLLADD